MTKTTVPAVSSEPRRGRSPADVHVGALVRQRRTMLGMSQEALGKRLNLTFQQVQKYEKGANRIGAGRLYEISAILGVSPLFFFEGLPNVETNAPPETADAEARAAAAYMLTPEGVAVARTFASISRLDVRAKLLKLAQSIAGQEAG